ncbi:MAG: DUF2510 domain-containing protein [Pseudonocardiales bacterium]
MYPAGWFADPQDPNLLRYYDGQAWTEHRRPVPPPSSPGPSAAPSQQPVQPAPPAQPPQAAQPQWGYQTPQHESTTVLPVVPAQPPQAAQTAQPVHPPWGEHAQQPQAAQPAPPVWQPTATPAWQQPPVAPGYPPHYPPPTRRRNRPLIFGVLAVVVIGLLVGAYFVFFKSPAAPTITYQGAKIKDASAVLKKAEQNLETVVAKRHGAKGDNTRCYFAVPKAEPAAAKKGTDVDSNLRCGPVLFVDGDASRQYLKFALTRSGTGEPATLTAATSPLTDAPVSADEVKLQRPDGKDAPSGTGGLKVPNPPPAAAGSIAAAELGPITVPAAPKAAILGSWSGGITLTNLGPVTRYGTGDAARSAPSGQKLIAFTTKGALGNDGTSTDLTSSAKVSVDGGAGRAVPNPGSGEYVVVVVPSGAGTVDLVLSERGLRQSISLLTGKPGANNVVVLARQNRETRKLAQARAVFTFSPSVIFSDGSTGTTEAAVVTFRLADIAYRNIDLTKTITASSHQKAIMHVSLTYVGAHDSGTFGFPSGLVTFTPTGGLPSHARNLSVTSGRIFNVFEVPGNVTSGVLTLTGSINQPFQGSTGSYRFGIQTPVQIPISIPAG